MKSKQPKYISDKTYKVTVVYEYKGYEMEEVEKKIESNKHKIHWFPEEKYEPRNKEQQNEMD